MNPDEYQSQPGKWRLSIITAIHNGLAMNRLFWKALSENTSEPFELIIVDNHSTDGSEHFFAELARARLPRGHRVVVIRNETNQSYPASQIQGMKIATGDVLAFLNNDIWTPRGWYEPLAAYLEKDPLRIVSPSGQEAQPKQSLSDALKRRWRNVTRRSLVWKFLLRQSEEARLWKSLEWMYGDLDAFRSPTPEGVPATFDGIKGDAVLFHRDLLAILPSPWDERIEAADWHLYLMAADRHEREGTLPLPAIVTTSYVHHFGRYSARQQYEPLPEGTRFKSIDEIWGDTVRRLWWGYRLPS